MQNRKRILDLFLCFFSFIILILGFLKGYQKPFCSFYLFTRQTILLINLYFLTNLCFAQENRYFSFICALDSLIMIIICAPIIKEKTLFQKKTFFSIIVFFLEHYVLTTIFVFYYLVIDQTVLKLKKFYIGIVHLLVYFITSLYVWKKYHHYPYEFLNPQHHFFFYKIIVLSVLIVCIAFWLIYLKNQKIKRSSRTLFKHK
ncbi:hypothetical protein ['Cynodon dactylon' phytoplasma]|uniref:hypothetical protein n=1 Tax='Cynodon dactylon' phytoplasma TaxID=295320 RepID=UPI001265CAFE|nr:hypothetical protein ['Cynodon dactylon' phytoplasma]KAB8121797.1 hypothetical protein F1741_01555 ['Cynodon dactylon' phytoplasma]